jgi:hypothetical protein
MRHHFINISILALFLGFIAGCSDSTSPDDGNGTVNVSTELASGGSVSSAYRGKVSPSAVLVDSLKVTSAAVVISNLKMHRDGSSDSTDDGTVKTGPFLLVFDSAGSHLAVTSTIPAGTYDRIKFEIHKLRNVDSALKSQLPDFVANDATIRISGYTWTAGIQTAFTYYADNTENIQIEFEPPITLEEGGTANITLQFDAAMAFTKGGVLDPLDPTNRNDIRGLIHKAFLGLKK